MTDQTRVLVVDDHEMVRLGLVSYLETETGIEVVGEAANGRDAVRLVDTLCPDVVLMDLLMDEMDGISATTQIMKAHPEVKIIVLTSYVEDEMVYPALEAGAVSYLLKTAKAQEIADAVRSAMRGESVVDPKIVGKLMKRVKRDEHLLHEDLTERETEVLTLIAHGMANQEIADQLHIGIKTVKTHVSNVLSKLEVSDRTQAAVYAHRHGLVKD